MNHWPLGPVSAMTLNYEIVAFTFNRVKKPSAPTECRESMISRYAKGGPDIDPDIDILR